MIWELEADPGSVIAACSRVDVLFFAPPEAATAAVGRFRKARHADELRQRPSDDSLIA